MSPKQHKPSVSPARRAAFDILRRVEAEGAYASALIAALAQTGLSHEDRALAQEITLGVLRWRKQLDHLITRLARRAVERMDLSVLLALRIGLYQLLHLTRVPQSAAVNESVNLVKRARVASAAGFVNAVLRNAVRQIDDRVGEDIADSVERASIELSHPRWMLERWAAHLGFEESLGLARANNEPPPLAFRVNTLRTSANDALASLQSESIVFRESCFVPGAFVVERGQASEVLRAAERGLVYIQDEASQLVSLLLGAKSGHQVLDLCAAPGSKSSHIAALTADNAWVVACDIHPHRLRTLGAARRRLGARSVDAVALDGTRELPITPEARGFDRVLIDAPCSGTGTLRRNPEIKWRLTPYDILRLADVQLALLSRATDVMVRGARLVYSTCSVEPEENEYVINRFLGSGAPFRLIRPEAHTELITGDGFVRTYPHRHGTDGFFAAVLERVE